MTLRRFFDFCNQNLIPIKIPLGSLTIAHYLEHLKEQTSAKSALSNALISIKWLHGTGYKNEIKSETICKGHKIVWKLRGNAIIMVFMIFSFFFKNYKALIYTISNKKNDF